MTGSPKAPVPLRLGTAAWTDGSVERQALVALLPSDPDRLVDLNRVERARQSRLGEGRPELLADALVPSSLREALEAGPRCLQRLRQVLAYAEKWHRRGDLPEALAPGRDRVSLLPCLPRPSLLRRGDGLHLDRMAVQGPGSVLHRLPQPTLAAVGLQGGRPGGFCLAVEDAQGAVLGGFLEVDFPWKGCLELSCGERHRRAPFEAWEGIALPVLRPGEVLLLPPPRLKALPGLVPSAEFRITVPWESLSLSLAQELIHPTLQ